MICQNCGTSCPEGSAFCMSCGIRLSPAPAAEPTAAAPSAEAPYILKTPGIPMSSAASGVTIPQQASQPHAPTPDPVSPPAPVQVPPRRGTHWIPISIMALICVIGLSLFLALPFAPAAQGPAGNSDTPWFYNDNGTLYFYEEYYNGSEELTVPDIVDGQPVTALGEYCFSGCDFTTVILPNTLESIGSSAFESCTSMRGIYLPEGLTYIGSRAFFSCHELEAICIPSTVKTIESGAFDGCFDLDYILYNGIHSHWLNLYGDMIGKKTQVYCMDGTFVHRHTFP